MSACTSALLNPGAEKIGKNGAELRLIEMLRVKLLEARGLPAKNSGSSDRTVFCLVKLDKNEVFQSSCVRKSVAPFFGDDFTLEVPRNFRQLHFYLCEQYSGRVPRPFAKASFRKSEVLNKGGMGVKDFWVPLKAYNRQTEVCGKVCLEVCYQECLTAGPSDVAQLIQLRVLDYSDLNVPAGKVDLYALVTLQIGSQRLDTKKLRIINQSARRKNSKSTDSSTNSTVDEAPCLSLDLNSSKSQSFGLEEAERWIRFSLWHDLYGGLNSYFHGEIRIPIDDRHLKSSENGTWYYLKPRTSNGSNSESQSQELGSLRLQINYQVDHVLPSNAYNGLWTLIVDSLRLADHRDRPFVYSPAGLLQLINAIDLESVARPLMKVCVQSDQIRPLLRLVAAWEMEQCEDVNTLFRSSSLASKLVYELMKFVGHQYLLITLKPCIDKIYMEKKSCEIDPVKLRPDQNKDENMTNLIIYTELIFSRIVDSNHRCPPVLKEAFSDLRDAAAHQFPNDIQVQRLVMSSFLVMRFFAAAILNPKLFGLKKDNAEPVVGRTLALISKIVQKLSNFVVCGHQLNSKESWLQPVLEKFMDEQHRLAMCKLLDRICAQGGENSISGESINLLREGPLTERFPRQKRCLRLSWLSSKRRHVMLSETEFAWSKNKSDPSPLDRMNLSEINVIQAVDEQLFSSKHVFQVASSSQTVYLQATTSVEMTEWVVTLQKQCKRQRLAARQSSAISQLYEIDLERELESIHMVLLEHAETLRHWKNELDGSATVPSDCQPLPAELKDSAHKQVLYDSLQSLLCTMFTLEQQHRDAIQRRLKQIKYGSKDNPIGDDNYLLLKARMGDLPLS